jgi:hypothetical protein
VTASDDDDRRRVTYTSHAASSSSSSHPLSVSDQLDNHGLSSNAFGSRTGVDAKPSQMLAGIWTGFVNCLEPYYLLLDAAF